MLNQEEHSPPSRERILVQTALAVTPATLGCAVGMLIGGRMKRRNREAVAVALVTLAAAAAVPAAVELARSVLNRPQSRRVATRVQRGIRYSDGIALDEAEEQIAGHLDDPSEGKDLANTVHFPG